MTATTFQSLVAGLPHAHRANLACILEIESEDTSAICERVRWLYHSKVRAGLRAQGNALADTVLSKTTGKRVRAVDKDYPPPTWEHLVEGLGRKLRVHDADADVVDNEWYICDRVIVDAMAKMSPKQRRQFFEAGASATAVAEDAHKKGRLKGPLRTASALGLANAWGFGLYQTATTALAFVTQAVGISLPFAAYTGLSSTIAFVLGPAGWLGVGLWTFLKVTSADWRKLTPVIIYVIQAKEQSRLGVEPISDG